MAFKKLSLAVCCLGSSFLFSSHGAVNNYTKPKLRSKYTKKSRTRRSPDSTKYHRSSRTPQIRGIEKNPCPKCCFREEKEKIHTMTNAHGRLVSELQGQLKKNRIALNKIKINRKNEYFEELSHIKDQQGRLESHFKGSCSFGHDQREYFRDQVNDLVSRTKETQSLIKEARRSYHQGLIN